MWWGQASISGNHPGTGMLGRFLLTITIVMAAVLAASCQLANSSLNENETPTPASYFDGTITLELIAPSEVSQGEVLMGLDVVMTNEGQEPFAFCFGSDLRLFNIIDGEGKEVWHSVASGEGWLAFYTLEPGESRVLSSLSNNLAPQQWDLRDPEGFPSGPGKYQVKGMVTLCFESPEPGLAHQRLETSVHTLTIKEAPMPEYAQGIELALTAPAEARAGDPVPMDMHITNKGNGPVVLWWGDEALYLPDKYLDIVIFEEDKPIWRATSAQGVPSWLGIITLNPGESQTMSNMSFDARKDAYWSSGKPLVWNQVANCDAGFEPCDEPVGPGTYTIRGVVNVSPPEALGQEGPLERTTIATEPHQLVITP
ncbi:MAG: hypothetical protein ABID84_03420 [Chloroflexota bacterium]